MPVIVIRPEPGCSASVAAAQALGLDARAFPLFEVEPCHWDAPGAETFDALLIGSANALRHGGAALAAYAGMPAYCVGEATAEAARAAGLLIAAIGNGGLQAVLAQIAPDHRRLLRLAGQERVALEIPPQLSITERVVYASKALKMPESLAGLLAGPALVLLHSAAAARHFAAQCDLELTPKPHIALAALGPRIAEAAGQGWGRIAVASAPNDHALLALAREMCQVRAAPKD